MFGIVGIYVNKNLRLDNVQVYGFDYDYTLAHYSANLQCLIYDLAKGYLVNEVCYLIYGEDFISNSLNVMSHKQVAILIFGRFVGF